MTANFHRCNYELISCFVISTELINIEREAVFFLFIQHIQINQSRCLLFNQPWEWLLSNCHSYKTSRRTLTHTQ